MKFQYLGDSTWNSKQWYQRGLAAVEAAAAAASAMRDLPGHELTTLDRGVAGILVNHALVAGGAPSFHEKLRQRLHLVLLHAAVACKLRVLRVARACMFVYGMKTAQPAAGVNCEPAK